MGIDYQAEERQFYDQLEVNGLSPSALLLSRLNCSVEQRQTKRSMLSDLRDSRSIEQDADIVMLLYRDDYDDYYDINVQTTWSKSTSPNNEKVQLAASC